MRSLVETGVLVGEKGAYRPGLESRGYPYSEHGAESSGGSHRSTPARGKTSLQTAAVIGVIVPCATATHGGRDCRKAIQAYLTHLQAAEFLYESNLFPELEYTFKHALTNEVAYGALIQSRKIDLLNGKS